jgi:hypothetical protein
MVLESDLCRGLESSLASSESNQAEGSDPLSQLSCLLRGEAL